MVFLMMCLLFFSSCGILDAVQDGTKSKALYKEHMQKVAEFRNAGIDEDFIDYLSSKLDISQNHICLSDCSQLYGMYRKKVWATIDKEPNEKSLYKKLLKDGSK